MSEIFLKILNLSINATWLILAVIILRFLMKKVPRWITCILWALVAIRLVCPFSMESVFSLLPSGEVIPADIAMERKPVIYTGISVINDTVNPVISETFAPTMEDSANPLQILLAAASFLWGVGMILMLSYALLSFLLLKRKVRASIPVGERIMACDEVKTPFILGMIRPVIYLPSSLSGQTYDMVKAHEAAHIKRLDHWWKPLGFVLLSVYWFNPACWVAYILLCRDIEAACDEKVIQDKGREYAVAYSEALLALSRPRRVVAVCPLAFGETDVKRRGKGGLHYKKPAFWVLLCALAGCVVVAICFLTNPVSENVEAQAEASATVFSEVPRPAVNLADIEGADMTQLLYADKDIIIFSDYYGLFVYSKSDGAVIAGVDLKAIGCEQTQGDNACEKFVSEDGSTVYLHPMTSAGMYVYQYKTDRLTAEDFRMDGLKLHTLPEGNEDYHFGDYDEWTDNGKQMVTRLQHGGTIGELSYADLEKGQEEAGQYVLLFAEETESRHEDIAAIYGETIGGLADDELFAIIDTNAELPVLLVASQVYQDGMGNQATIICDIYYPVDGAVKNIGTIKSMGTAYPIAYDETGIYAVSGHNVQHFEIQKSGEIKMTEDTAFEKYGNATIVSFAYGASDAARMETHKSRYYYICSHDGDRLLLDDVEWITTGSERARELGLTEDDMPGGFYVYNKENAQFPAVLTDACTFTILDWEDRYSVQQVNKDTFLSILDERLAFYQEIEGGYSGPPYIIEMDAEGISSIREQYVP